MLPTETWGKHFYFTSTRFDDVYRIVANEDNTRIVVNFTTITLNKGRSYDGVIGGTPVDVLADKPISVNGYSVRTCASMVGNDTLPTGDMSMYTITPLDQPVKQAYVGKIATPSIDSQFVNIMARTADTSSVKMNGIKIGQYFQVYNSFPDYAYATIPLRDSANVFSCDSGFTGTVFGYSHQRLRDDAYAFPLGGASNNIMSNLPVPFQVSDRTFNTQDTVPLCAGYGYKFGVSTPYDAQGWTFENSGSAAGSKPTYTFPDSGLYKVRIKLTYPWVCSLKDTIKYVRVTNNCFQARPDTSMCKGTTVQLHAKSKGLMSDTCLTYQWFIRGNSMGIGRIGVFPVITTQYTVVFTDKCLKIKDTAFVNIGIYAPLVIKMSRDTSICFGNSVHVTAKASGSDSNYVYKWVSGLMGTGFTGSLVGPDTTTTYAVTMQDICKTTPDTAYTKVKVSEPLKLTLSPDTIMCEGQTTRLKATASGGDFSYTFPVEPACLGMLPNVTVSPKQTTTYQMILDDECSPHPDTGTVTVYVRPKACC